MAGHSPFLLAQAAFCAGEYLDCVKYTKSFVDNRNCLLPLNYEERSFVVCAYRSLCTSFVKSIQTLLQLVKNVSSRSEKLIAVDYVLAVLSQYRTYCHQMLSLLSKKLISPFLNEHEENSAMLPLCFPNCSFNDTLTPEQIRFENLTFYYKAYVPFLL